MAASTAPSRSGSASAAPRIAGTRERRPLCGHDVARLDGNDVAIIRLVRARAGAHVDDCPASPSADTMRRRKRGSSRRVRA